MPLSYAHCMQAMRAGDVLLIDELNLAEDAVLERLNSVLEPGRSLTLAEKGGDAARGAELVVAHPAFRIVATMNPGKGAWAGWLVCLFVGWLASCFLHCLVDGWMAGLLCNSVEYSMFLADMLLCAWMRWRHGNLCARTPG